MLERLELGGGIEPEFVAERGPQVGVGPQRFGPAARAVERQHELGGEALAERMLADESLQLADQLAGQATAQVGIDPQLDRLQAQLVEPEDLGLRERFVGEVLVGPTPPQAERFAEDQGGDARVDVE